MVEVMIRWNDNNRLSRVKCKEWRLYFDKGAFDNWCVHTFDSRKRKKYFPLDYDYLYWIQQLGLQYGNEKVYNDFLQVYECVRKDVTNRECYEVTREVDSHYVEDTQVWWVIFFMTMYAECMKENTKLGKRIKHLAVYNVLIDKDEVEYVTQYMKNTEHLPDWYKYLERLMEARGI